MDSTWIIFGQDCGKKSYLVATAWHERSLAPNHGKIFFFHVMLLEQVAVTSGNA